MKPDCYKCEYRGTIPGDAHSRCKHPDVDADACVFDALVKLLSGQFHEAAKKLNIIGDPYGVRMGWFYWPANFDPGWLFSCNGFKPLPDTKQE